MDVRSARLPGFSAPSAAWKKKTHIAIDTTKTDRTSERSKM